MISLRAFCYTKFYAFSGKIGIINFFSWKVCHSYFKMQIMINIDIYFSLNFYQKLLYFTSGHLPSLCEIFSLSLVFLSIYIRNFQFRPNESFDVTGSWTLITIWLLKKLSDTGGMKIWGSLIKNVYKFVAAFCLKSQLPRYVHSGSQSFICFEYSTSQHILFLCFFMYSFFANFIL